MMKRTFLWSVVAMMFMTSCQDEFIKNEHKTSDKIGYAVETNSISEPLKVRASRSTDNTDVAIEEMGQTLGGKPLYLHTVTDMVVPMDIKAEKKKDSKNAQSRAAETTAAGVTDIGVTSVVWNGDSWADATDHRVYMDNVLSEATAFQTNYYWPAAEQRIRFFAYSPKAAGVIEVSDDRTNLTFDYIVPNSGVDGTNDALPQHDLLVASSDEPGNKKDIAPLYFGHALTAVKFKLADGITGVKVTAVRIKGVKYKGTYTYNYCGHNSNDGDSDTPDTDTGTWNVEDDIYTGTNGEGFEITGLEATSGIINDGANTFMMMPQTLPADATIEVDVIDTGAGENAETQTLTAIIGDVTGNGNKVWQKGTKVIYTVSFNTSTEQWFFEFLDEDGNVITESDSNGGIFNWYGGFGNYTIRSYKKITKLGNSTPDYEPAEWVVSNRVSVDFVEKEEGSGVTIPQGETDVNNFVPEGPYDYGVMPGTLTSTIHEKMAAYTTRGTKADPMDLSLYDNISGGWNGMPELNETGRNTANCYIVRAPGYYKFPVVYGNAITDDVDNPASYRMGEANATKPFTAKWHTCSTVNGSVTYDEGTDKTFTAGILGAFYDHTGGQDNANTSVIKGPWIADQGASYQPTSARLIWQDAPGLITNVKLMDPVTEDGSVRHYISFDVNPDAICEGNAVIAVCSDEKTTDPLDGSVEPRIMWSWHIWVSDVNLAGIKPITNRRVLGNYNTADTVASNWTREESTFNMLPVQVGYCSAEVKEYAASPGSLTFNQVDENGFIKNTYTISFTRSESQTVKANANAPVYQWGRKDPMLPFHYSSTESAVINKYYYTNSRERKNTPQISSGTGAKAISLSIQEPEIFMRAANTVNDNINSRNWCAGNYINLWNANCDELPMFPYKLTVNADEYHNYYNKLVNIPVVKTVYDPCPPGWEVPRIDAFTGTTFDGTTEKNFFVDINSQTFSTKANVGSLRLNSPVEFEISIYSQPMPSIDKRVGDNFEPTGPNDFNPQLFWILALGLRDDGLFRNYASAGSCLTSGMMLIQWVNEQYDGSNGSSINYELNSSRFYFTADGSLKPMSGSFPDKAFGIFPARTGSNPIKTEVLVGGDINPWVDGDHIEVEF